MIKTASTPKKVISVYVAVSLLISSIYPARVKAVTGPASPEFSSFESVTTNNMVSEFSGDFNYSLPVISIPGPDGAGYALSLSYKSGTSPDEDASWVGYGFTLNPGAIVRSKSGFPDDMNGVSMTSYNDVPVNWTVGLGINGGVTIEGFSLSASIGEALLLQYNINKGFSYSAIPNIGVAAGYGLVSLNLAAEDGKGSFSAAVNPSAIIKCIQKAKEKSDQETVEPPKEAPTDEASDKQAQKYAQGVLGGVGRYSNAFVAYLADNTSRNTNIPSYTAGSFKLQVGVQGEPSGVPIGLGADMYGTYSYQKADEKTTYPCYGYLYSANATSADALMDYYTEHDEGYNKRDYNLSVPYARPDQFILMGEGLSGGFRAFSKNVGHFSLNEVNNETVMAQLGIDVMLGMDNGVGGSGQMGSHSIEQTDWNDDGNNDAYNFSNSGDEAFYMSFMMDPSQYMSYGGNTVDLQAQAFSLEQTSSIPGAKSYIPKYPSSLHSSVDVDTDNNKRIPRSSQVIYHTNRQMTSDKDNGGNYYNRYSRPEATYERFLDRASADVQDQIGEFVVYNNTGNQYVYGLPVYSQKELSMSYDISSPSKDYIVSEDISTYERKVGDSTGTPYATSWLLTSITTPNYIDRTMDGPSADDFGGWTQFKYAKKYGNKLTSSGTSKWYHWRTPYNGLFNNPGSLSDDSDDMGSFSSGDKEIYYLDTIETKTNLAIFYKSNRKDGYDAADDKTAANSFSAQGNNPVQRLDSIYLYSKDASGAVQDVIKRVYFEYDYSLMQSVPNAKGTSGNDGVLTLKKVWFEYGNVRNANIAPYIFSYTYPADGTYPPKYSTLDNYGAYSAATQNPSYNKCNIDRWGAYQYNGSSRLNKLNPWVNQVPSTTAFDPAAWQLKSITLPTGGQIHPQYEQDDYRFVQDRRAMAMVSLSTIVQPGNYTTASAAHPEGNLGDKYYLKLADLGISSAADKAALVEQLKKQFVDGENGQDPERIYFKFLYSLTTATASLTSCGSDYISGYVKVVAVGSDATGVYLQLGSSTSSVELLDDDETYSIPRQVCLDFYDKTRIGNLNSKDITCNVQSIEAVANNGDGATAAIYALLGMVSDNVLMENHSSLCLDIDESNSYLRIPVIKSKKGGGLRVKRLLMYDAGIESNDASLYGKEYMYQGTDGYSSGVASNEPSLGRNESALVTYLDKRRDSNILQKVMSGEDLDQFEGPYGEGILPGASVGYSRVVAKNIHTDKNTNDGFSVSEFLTTYDYPFDKKYSYKDASGNTVNYNGVDETEMEQETDWLPLYALIYNRVVSNAWASQGYRFIVNDMNGKPKKNAVYSGDYNYVNIADSITQISGEEYSYFEPLEPVPVVSRWEWKDESAMVPEYRVLGKQMDVVCESRAIKDHLNDVTVEYDASIGIWGLIGIPWLTAMAYINETIGELYTHVTNKVIYAPTQLKSIRKYQDGIYVDSKTDYFDANTGEAMVSVTNDGYNDLRLDGAVHDGRYVNYSFPAAHYYDGMGLRSNTDGYHFSSPSNFKKSCPTTGGTYLEYTSTGCALDALTPGDLLALTSTSGVKEVYNVGEIVGKTAQLLKNGDFYQNTTEYDMADIAIVRTAKTNQISESVGGITTYGGYPDVTNVPIDAGIITARKQVATKLNTMITSSGTITSTVAFSNVSIIDTVGNCVPLSLSVTSKRYNEAVNYSYVDTVVTCVEEQCNFGGGFTYGDPPVYIQPSSTPINEEYVHDYTATQPPYFTCWDCDTTYPKISKVKYVPKITLTVNGCTITFTYTSTYKFYIDAATGELMYGKESDPCDAVRVDCFDFCPDEYASVQLDGVVASSAAWLSDDWGLSSTLKDVYDIPGTDLNDYEYGAKGKWHGKYSYDYNTSVSRRTASAGRTWDAGIYDDFTVFNWDYEEANDSVWTMLNTTTKVSPYGATLEEKNALGIYSCLKMGYDFSLPYLTAVNSTYNNTFFEGFETAKESGTTLNCEDGFTISQTSGYYGDLVPDTGHTGNQSLRMKFVKSSSTSAKGITTYTFESSLTLPDIQLNDQVINEGVLVKLWMKSDKTVSTFSLKYKKYDTGTSSLVDASVSFTKVAQTGDWTLYEAKITDFGASIKTVASSITPSVYMKNTSVMSTATAPKVYFDDVRMQPLDAQVTAYVYDPATLRLIASFDDQHFSLLYQYSAEGKLVRKLKETVEGVKTITETQYNVPKNIPRPY